MKKRTAQEGSSSAQTVATIDDLLVEILLRLPMKSLIRFKSVSKHWLSLITNPQFALRRNPNPNPAIGLFVPSTINSYEYIPFDVKNSTSPPFKSLKSTRDLSHLYIVNSCNGLLLCATSLAQESNPTYYVYNSTTKQLTTLPKPRRGSRREVCRGVTLAFDPVKSPHYKVICVRDFGIYPRKYQIEIYSSETGPWRASGWTFTEDVNTSFRKGVYWNGAVHWISGLGEMTSLYFSVDEERLGLMPIPPVPGDLYSGYNINYFGESCDHLHLIDIYGLQLQFDVYQLRRDYSEWFVKYHVDLAEGLQRRGCIFGSENSWQGHPLQSCEQNIRNAVRL